MIEGSPLVVLMPSYCQSVMVGKVTADYFSCVSCELSFQPWFIMDLYTWTEKATHVSVCAGDIVNCFGLVKGICLLCHTKRQHMQQSTIPLSLSFQRLLWEGM